MAHIFICSCCRCKVVTNPRVKKQRYCGKSACQRERKRRWQQVKMATDPGYRANQRDAQRSWRERNPDYRRKRKPPPHRVHPLVAEKKMDALDTFFVAETMEYIISPIDLTGCKMDTLRVKIIAVPGG